MPPALVFLLLLANDPAVMGSHRNGWALNLAGVTVTVLMVGSGLAYGASVLFPSLFGGSAP
jgi:Mn2+/Fe2+ NRAMP family transporter